MKRDCLDTRVVATETYGADSLAQSVEKAELVTLPAITSIATSLGARTVCQKAFEHALRGLRPDGCCLRYRSGGCMPEVCG